MHALLHARVPLACLPPSLAAFTPASPVEPWLACDILIEGNRITAVTPHAPAAPHSSSPGCSATDLAGSLVFPGLLDAHTHLDKAHTWDRAPNPRGEFWDAIRILQEDKIHWSQEDLFRRARFALRRAWAHGTVALRTHVDTSPSAGDAAHEVMRQLRREWAGRVELQTVSLCHLKAFAHGEATRVVEMTARHHATALGGFPQPNPDLPRQLDSLFAAARELGLGLDLHIDESGLTHAECLRATAEAVLRHEFPHPVTCGHNCSLAIQDPARARDTIDLVRRAGIHIVSLPLCNLYLQGRVTHPDQSPGTPAWRGVTLVHELLDAGVTVACASDNVRDAFYAWGDLDLLEVFAQSIRIIHLDTRMAAAPSVVTTAPAAIMGLPDCGRVAPGARANLVVAEARSFSELLAAPGAPRRLIHGETFRERLPPPYSELDL